MDRFGTEEQCRHYLAYVRWKGKPCCVYCQSSDVYIHKTKPLYTCKNKQCKKQFQAKTNTIFSGSSVPLTKWFMVYYFMTTHKKGVSSVQLAKHCSLDQKTAWRMMQKIRKTMGNDVILLKGIVEADETYFGPKIKGSRRGRGAQHKTPIFGMVERNGCLKIMPVESVNRETLQGKIRKYVEVGSTIMTDEFKSYYGLDKLYIHETVQHSSWEYVRGEAHTNTIEGAWSHLKRGPLKGTYQRPSKRYLDLYCNEFEFRWNNRKKALYVQFNKAISQSLVLIRDKDFRK